MMPLFDGNIFDFGYSGAFSSRMLFENRHFSLRRNIIDEDIFNAK